MGRKETTGNPLIDMAHRAEIPDEEALQKATHLIDFFKSKQGADYVVANLKTSYSYENQIEILLSGQGGFLTFPVSEVSVHSPQSLMMKIVKNGNKLSVVFEGVKEPEDLVVKMGKSNLIRFFDRIMLRLENQASRGPAKPLV